MATYIPELTYSGSPRTNGQIIKKKAYLRKLRDAKPRDGVHWAHPSPNAKGPAWGPSGGVRINTPKSGSGGALIRIFDLYAEPFPLVA